MATITIIKLKHLEHNYPVLFFLNCIELIKMWLIQNTKMVYCQCKTHWHFPNLGEYKECNEWTTMVWQDAMQNKMAVPTFSEGQIIIMLQLQMRNIPNQATFYNISRNSETNNNTQYHTQRDCKHRTAFCSVRNKRSVRTMNGQKPTSHFLNTIRVSFSRRYCPLSFAPLSSSSSESSFQLSCTIAATFFSYSRLFSR